MDSACGLHTFVIKDLETGSKQIDPHDRLRPYPEEAQGHDAKIEVEEEDARIDREDSDL